jgi:hypothetical protein
MGFHLGLRLECDVPSKDRGKRLLSDVPDVGRSSQHPIQHLRQHRGSGLAFNTDADLTDLDHNHAVGVGVRIGTGTGVAKCRHGWRQYHRQQTIITN